MFACVTPKNDAIFLWATPAESKDLTQANCLSVSLKFPILLFSTYRA